MGKHADGVEIYLPIPRDQLFISQPYEAIEADNTVLK